jgi:hypothetical protein
MSRLVTTLSERIESGEAQKEGLVDLLPALDGRNKASKSVFTAAKQFLTQRLDEFEDFSNVARFAEKFPGAIDSDELDRIRQEFRHFSKSYTHVSERDPNLLRSIAEEVTTVGKQLEVDVSEWADPLFQKAEEIESEGPSDPEPDDSDRGWLDDSKALRDVDLMFGD